MPPRLRAVFRVWGLLIAVRTAPAVAQEPLSPDDAASLAIAASPAVAEALGRLEAAEGRRAQASFLMTNPNFNTQVGAVGRLFQFQIAQPVSITGEGLRAKAAARAEVDASEKAVERAQFEAAAAARRAWAVVAAARQREGIAREAARLAAQLAEAMRLQYEAGEVPALDLRLARLALAQADTNVLDAMREQAEASRELSRIVGRSVDPASISGDPLAAAPPASGDVAETRSDVLAARSTVVSAEASLARARAAAVPRMGLGLYTQWDDETGWILGPNLEWEIPSFNRNQEGRGEASGELLASRAELGAVEAGADVERRTSMARVATADAALAPTEDLEAEAREALISIDTGRRAGELDLPTTLVLRDRVLGAMTALVELRRAVAEARIDLLLATEDRALVPEGAR